MLTDNCIGEKGAITIGESLKINTTLTALNLNSDENESNEFEIW